MAALKEVASSSLHTTYASRLMCNVCCAAVSLRGSPVRPCADKAIVMQRKASILLSHGAHLELMVVFRQCMLLPKHVLHTADGYEI